MQVQSSVKTSLVRQRNRWESGRRGSAVPGGEPKPRCKSIPREARFQVLPPLLKQQKLVILHHFINSTQLRMISLFYQPPCCSLYKIGQARGEKTIVQVISSNRPTPTIWKWHRKVCIARLLCTTFHLHAVLRAGKIILGVLKQALKISSSSINIKLSHSLWQRHLLKAIICLNIPHSVGRTWVMLRACCRMQSCIIL